LVQVTKKLDHHNGYALSVALMIGLTVTNYGFPIAALLTRTGVSVPAVYVGTHP
jgi:cytochrome c oxidase subunit 1